MTLRNHKPGARVAMYSHDAMGLGHIRRNILIAECLIAEQAEHDVLLLSGAHEAVALASAPGIDCLTLPTLRKTTKGGYESRCLNIKLPDLVDLRAKTIGAALHAFEPDLLFVDKKPRGALGELESTLEFLRANGRTRLVLGLRDILDSPDVVQREWEEGGYTQAVADYYDAVWVYGDRNVYDLGREAGLPPAIAERLEYTGYFDHRLRLTHAGIAARESLASCGVDDAPFALCLVGGGEDGMQVAKAFTRAEFPAGWHGILVTGPFMSTDVRLGLRSLAACRPELHVLDFVSEPAALISAAARIVSMGGYSTMSEIISFEQPALIVPRVHPRQEQLIRAKRYAELGLTDMLVPEELTPGALSTWLNTETNAGQDARSRLDLKGCERLPHMVEALLDGRRSDPHTFAPLEDGPLERAL